MAHKETIFLAGGCFWCTEAVFDRVKGVIDVESGYANGQVPNPTYEAVCSGRTGYAEVIKVEFDPQVIDVAQILAIFFAVHDPTTLNRQGHDVGTQYRSGVYCTSAAQLAQVQAWVEDIKAQRVFESDVVTEVEPLHSYWPAENYHQDYFARNPEQGYCAAVAAPKVVKLQACFAEWLK